jgi:hypothetical protein
MPFFGPASFGRGFFKAGVSVTIPGASYDYLFNEGSGTTASPVGGGGDDLTITGGSWGTGYLSLDGNTGTNEYTSAAGLWHSIGDFAHSGVIWFMPNALSANTETLFRIGTGGGTTAGAQTFAITYAGLSNRLEATAWDAVSASKTTNFTGSQLSNGTKYLLMWTYNPSTNDNCTLKLYLAADGNPASLVTVTDSTQKLWKQNNTHKLVSKALLGATTGMDVRRYRLTRYDEVLTQDQFLELLDRGSEA